MSEYRNILGINTDEDMRRYIAALKSGTAGENFTQPIVFTETPLTYQGRPFYPSDVPKVRHADHQDPVRLLRHAGAKFSPDDHIETVPFDSKDLADPEHPISAINEVKFAGLPFVTRRQLHLLAAVARAFRSGRRFVVDYAGSALREWKNAVGEYGNPVNQVVKRNPVRPNNITLLLVGFDRIRRPGYAEGLSPDLLAELDRLYQRFGPALTPDFLQKYVAATPKQRSRFAKKLARDVADPALALVAGE